MTNKTRLTVALVLTVFLSWTVVQGQDGWSKERKNSALTFAYHYQIHSAIEFSKTKFLLTRTKSGGGADDNYYCFAKDWLSIGAGAEVEFAHNFIFAPKILGQFVYKPFFSSLSFSAFTDLKSIDPVLTPSIGLAFIDNYAFIGIGYGYNIHLADNSFYQIGQHRFSIFIGFKRDSYMVPASF